MARMNPLHCSAPPPKALDTVLEIELHYERSRLEQLSLEIGVAADHLRRYLRREINGRRVRRLPVREQSGRSCDGRLAA
jgi:hypothetical protein